MHKLHVLKIPSSLGISCIKDAIKAVRIHWPRVCLRCKEADETIYSSHTHPSVSSTATYGRILAVNRFS